MMSGTGTGMTRAGTRVTGARARVTSTGAGMAGAGAGVRGMVLALVVATFVVPAGLMGCRVMSTALSAAAVSAATVRTAAVSTATFGQQCAGQKCQAEHGQPGEDGRRARTSPDNHSPIRLGCSVKILAPIQRFGIGLHRATFLKRRGAVPCSGQDVMPPVRTAKPRIVSKQT
jgi:hypothetical protein